VTEKADIISAESIKNYLSFPNLAENIKVYSEIDSTNREAKSLASKKANHGTVIISDYQTEGKGRFNKNFFSPSGRGIYMSFILDSNYISFSNPTAITAYAAVSVCESIENVCDIKPSIKWVNDIFFRGKKIGGILTEAITDSETRSIGKYILGIGINVSTKYHDFPEAIRDSAGSLYSDGYVPITRNKLAAEIINLILLSTPNEKEVFEQYRKRLCMLGARITVFQGKSSFEAKAIDIDENGYLIVELEDGIVKTLFSGEISIII
jgi:BirA family biotin operon repressor/biotin-[acetyl-CoA-carboxylase] ligase